MENDDVFCYTSLSSGNQVDGLPLVASNTCAGVSAGHVARNICGVNDRFFLNFSRFICTISTPRCAHLDMCCILPHAKGRHHL